MLTIYDFYYGRHAEIHSPLQFMMKFDMIRDTEASKSMVVSCDFIYFNGIHPLTSEFFFSKCDQNKQPPLEIFCNIDVIVINVVIY